MPRREAEPTPDGHHLVIEGRRWRASDPAIPAALRAELVSELMTARRGVKTDPNASRPRVADAKVALGERGDPWWEPTVQGTRERLAATMRALLRHRKEDATICPSDAARAVGGSSWRELMHTSRDVAAELARDQVVVVRQGGVEVDIAVAEGPVRLGRGPNLLPPPHVS